MDIQFTTPKQLQFHDQIKLNSPVTHISSCQDFVGVVCLDDTIRVWKNYFNPFDKKIHFQAHQQFTGISDICFNHYSTSVATTCIGSEIKIWDLDSKQSKNILMPAIAPWKIVFADNELFACVDFGKVQVFDSISGEHIQKIDTGSAFLNSMTITPNQDKIAIGNVVGKAYIIKVKDRKIASQYQPHHKSITSIKFSNDGDKLLTGSDDTTIAISDIETKQVSEVLQGHLDKVSCVAFHSRHDHIIYSCSYDKTVKTWDKRQKEAVHTFQAHDKLRALHIIGKNLLLGGETGFLQFFTVQ